MDKFIELPHREFAMTASAVNFMQDAYGAFEELAKLAGNNVIISGIENDGENNISPGWAVLDNKLCYCEGGVGRWLRATPVETITEIFDGRGIRKQATYRGVVSMDYTAGDIDVRDDDGWLVQAKRVAGGIGGLNGLQMDGVEISGVDMSQINNIGYGTWRGTFPNVVAASVMVWRDGGTIGYDGNSSRLPAPVTVNVEKGSDDNTIISLRWDNTVDWRYFTDTTARRFTVVFFWSAGNNFVKHVNR